MAFLTGMVQYGTPAASIMEPYHTVHAIHTILD